MNEKKIQKFKNELLKMKKEIEEDIASSSGVPPKIPQYTTHMADTAGESLRRQTKYSVMNHSRELLREINTALEKIENGKYGICDNCHNKIQISRLEVKPFATYCIDCREISENI